MVAYRPVVEFMLKKVKAAARQSRLRATRWTSEEAERPARPPGLPIPTSCTQTPAPLLIVTGKKTKQKQIQGLIFTNKQI